MVPVDNWVEVDDLHLSLTCSKVRRLPQGATLNVEDGVSGPIPGTKPRYSVGNASENMSACSVSLQKRLVSKRWLPYANAVSIQEKWAQLDIMATWFSSWSNLSNLLSYFNSSERIITNLAPVSFLIDPECRLDNYVLMVACNFLYVLASETSSKVERSRRAIGFLQNKYCATCTTDHLDTVTMAADARKSVMVVYFEMTKDFDRVFHHRLLKKRDQNMWDHRPYVLTVCVLPFIQKLSNVSEWFQLPTKANTQWRNIRCTRPPAVFVSRKWRP